MNRRIGLFRLCAAAIAALGVGHYVQYRAAHKTEAAAAPLTKIQTVAAGPAVFQAAALASHAARAEPPAQPTPARHCLPELRIEARPQAMLSLWLDAPCAAGTDVMIRHAGLGLWARIGPAGQLALVLPAFDAAGAISLQFDDHHLTAAAAVPDLAAQSRFALQWLAGDGLALLPQALPQALLPLAETTAQAPPTALPAPLVSRFGSTAPDLGLRLDVLDLDGHYDWSIEAEVTAQNCGREALAETITLQAGQLSRSEVTLAMPGCEALGDRLQLKNPRPGERVAPKQKRA